MRGRGQGAKSPREGPGKLELARPLVARRATQCLPHRGLPLLRRSGRTSSPAPTRYIVAARARGGKNRLRPGILSLG